MSWQVYVDTNLVGSGKVSKAAILGQKGGVWATSPEFTLSPAEQTHVLGLFNNIAAAQGSGVTLAGTKYFALQVNDRSFYGKKQADGCVIVKTKQAILVTTFSAPTQMPESAGVVEALADYLIGVGY
ncbi:profilin, required for normal timing of actin polymerization in response to thermal stress [Ceratobasidium sp. 414]|nr:profilin, required for normal timing of actin polymerization in response to thermal stress [Ceratobasidium sp. 414]